MPARLRWSTRATPTCSSGRSRMRRSASSRSQSGAEDVGAEMADQPVLVGGGDDVDVVQPVADALPRVGGEHHPDVVGRPAVPARARAVDVPAAVHPEVGAQRASVVRTGSAGACRAARPRARWRRSGPGSRAGGCGTRRGAGCSRPARCSSAARPATRCLLRARSPVSPARVGAAQVVRAADSRDDDGAPGHCIPP